MTFGDQRRRWVSEEQVLGELERLSDLSMEQAAVYGERAEQAAMREADHKRLRARAILSAQGRAKGEGSRVSVAQAETEAEADDEVAQAYMDRLVAAAQADATRENLRSIRENQNALRTAAASARDGVVGPGWKGKP